MEFNQHITVTMEAPPSKASQYAFKLELHWRYGAGGLDLIRRRMPLVSRISTEAVVMIG